MAEASPISNPNKDGCTFCKILNGQAEGEIVYSDEDYACIVDIKPHAPHHYLIVPKAHHGNVKHLDSNHCKMVQQMVAIAEQVLRDKGCNLNNSRLGFHWPPFHSIEHLHLHALSPVSEMNFVSRRFIFRQNYPMVSSEWALDYLKKRQTPS